MAISIRNKIEADRKPATIYDQFEITENPRELNTMTGLKMTTPNFGHLKTFLQKSGKIVRLEIPVKISVPGVGTVFATWISSNGNTLTDSAIRNAQNYCRDTINALYNNVERKMRSAKTLKEKAFQAGEGHDYFRQSLQQKHFRDVRSNR